MSTSKTNEVIFLCKRLKELREKNNCTMDDLIERLIQLDENKFFGYNKSSISRLEAGKTSEKMVKEFAVYYCKAFGMSETQTKQFLRGEKIAVPDTSALLKNTSLIDELCKEYSRVIIPKPVLGELIRIKNNFDDKYTRGLSNRAWEVEKSINGSEKTETWEYSGDGTEDSEDEKIIWIAERASEKHHCKVDIITDDIDFGATLKRKKEESGNSPVYAVHLHEYMATRQEIVNMDHLIKINDYYADTYDDLEPPSKGEINAFLEDGTTLIISCVRRYDVPIEQRKAKIKWLIDNGADVNKRESANKYLPAISYAIQMKDQYEMFEFLLDECHADPNAGSRDPHGIGKVRQKNEGNMPLMIAAWWGKDEIVDKLCKHEDISINQQDENGFTALIKACANGNMRCAKILMEAGADIRIIDINGKNYQDHIDDCRELGPLRFRYRRGGRKNNPRSNKK